MKGGIYSEEKCPLCGATLQYTEKRGIACPEHPQIRGEKCRVVFGRQLRRKFGSLRQAEHFLNGIRHEVEQGKFDKRDYQKENPLGFITLAEEYLEFQKDEIKGSFRQVRYHMLKAIEYFGAKNIKTIQFAELQDFLLAKKDRAKPIMGNLSGKSRANIKATLHAFWVWLRQRRVISLEQMPEFPVVDFQLGWRTIVSKETQQAIIDKVYEQQHEHAIKAWIGIKWLATYPSIRPKELVSIREDDFSFELGGVWLRSPKGKEPLFIPMLEEDLEQAREFPRTIGNPFFFRHQYGFGGVRPGKQFGKDYLYKCWRRACSSLGIKGVDLYGGTKHSTVTALRLHYSPEQIKKATMHQTNKAFERYFKVQLDDVREVYRQGKHGGNKLAGKAEVKPIK